MTKRIICYHSWHPAFAGQAPSFVLGCCDRQYSCPVCGFGQGSYPHDNCQGWEPFGNPVDQLISEGQVLKFDSPTAFIDYLHRKAETS